MKLHEIKQLNESKFLTDRDEIKNWLIRWASLPEDSLKHFDISDTGVVSAKHHGVNVMIALRNSIPEDALVVKFGDITYFNAEYCSTIKNFDIFPETSTTIYANHSGITSFVGINDTVKKCNRIVISVDDYIEEGGLGLLLIENLSSIDIKLKHEIANNIISKYIRMGNGNASQYLFECQQELLENNLDQYAQI